MREFLAIIAAAAMSVAVVGAAEAKGGTKSGEFSKGNVKAEGTVTVTDTTINGSGTVTVKDSTYTGNITGTYDNGTLTGSVTVNGETYTSGDK